ncbi:hypothetical protein E2C01_083984 [Portunus trituberculatus]|uniref:Uncharacterized protein n=1 Tax=Portunus trituberculatus TaxID=210409 RepID=A0A5B7J534_PORTR|nr:hypothetical protein [Portunus trituberculatus]
MGRWEWWGVAECGEVVGCDGVWRGRQFGVRSGGQTDSLLLTSPLSCEPSHLAAPAVFRHLEDSRLHYSNGRVACVC